MVGKGESKYKRANGVCRQAESDTGNCNRLIESDDESSSGTNGGEYY